MFEKMSRSPRQENLDYFCGRPQDADRRQSFIDRGITPTNNLNGYFVVEPGTLVCGDFPHPLDYSRKPFGPVLQAFREQFPDLWEEGRQASAASGDLMRQLWDLYQSGDRDAAKAIEPQADEAYWRQAEVMDRAFQLLVPELEAAGIDPLDVCK